MDIALENRATPRGLSGFRLKDLALVCMVLDHAHYFFEADTPQFFSWIGRLAAPLFLFCLIEGFTHTRDKRRYVLTIYLLSAAMGLVRFSFYNVLRPLVRSDGFFPENAMLSSFSVLLFVLWGLSMISEKKYARGICFVIVPVAIPFLFVLLFSLCTDCPYAGFFINLLGFSFLPNFLWIKDGGAQTLLIGVALYLTRNRRVLRLCAFVFMTALTTVVFPLLLLRRTLDLQTLTIPSFWFFDFYEWMGVFAVVFMSLYNGKRGVGHKSFFYWFYPAHIYLLYAVSKLVYG